MQLPELIAELPSEGLIAINVPHGSRGQIFAYGFAEPTEFEEWANRSSSVHTLTSTTNSRMHLSELSVSEDFFQNEGDAILTVRVSDRGFIYEVRYNLENRLWQLHRWLKSSE